MSSTVALTGLLPFVVLVATFFAFPVCLLLLRLYRNSVTKGMAAFSGSAAASPELETTRQPPSSRLQFERLDATATAGQERLSDPWYRLATRGPWRASIVYALAGLAYSIVMTIGWLAATQDDAIVWIKLLILSWAYFWPAMLTVSLVAAYDKIRRFQLFGLYFLVFAVLTAIAIARNPTIGIGSLPLYWLIMNGPPTVLLLTFLFRVIRAVGPLVLAFMLLLAVGSQSILSLAASNENVLRTISSIGFQLGLNASGVFSGMIIIGVAVFGLLGWPLLRFLGRRYEQKKFSDQSIMLDSLWLLFAVVQSIGLAFEGPLWILTGLVALIAYKLVAIFGLAWTQASQRTNARTLLLLRVFALAKRSEQLFDKLRTHWQYAGNVTMIAGPDLVTTTIEPNEFLEFVSGRLGRKFVRDANDLESRVRAIDTVRDPDGRYRISEFFCHNDTWQMTMERLATTSDAILMDLRSFSPANQGCIFELGRLVDTIDLGRVVFLVDNTTDRGFLESTLTELWQNMDSDSPNQSTASPSARLFEIDHQSERQLKNLVAYLLDSRLRTTSN